MAGTTAACVAMLVGVFVGWGHAHLTAFSEWELATGLCASSMAVAIITMVLQFPSLGFVGKQNEYGYGSVPKKASSFFGGGYDFDEAI